MPQSYCAVLPLKMRKNDLSFTLMDERKAAFLCKVSFPCCTAPGVVHRQADAGGNGEIGIVKQQTHCGFRDLRDRLDNGGAGIAPGGIVGDAVVADKLYIRGDLNALPEEKVSHAAGKPVGVAEYPVKVRHALPDMPLQEIIKRGLGISVVENDLFIRNLKASAGGLKTYATLVDFAWDIGCHRHEQQPSASELCKLFRCDLPAAIKTNIPLELEEAATIDGCSRWQTWWRVVFPLLKPTIATVGIINAMAYWNDYLLPSLVLTKKNLYTIPIATQAFYGTYSTDIGLVMAALLLAMLPILILYVFLQRYIVEGVASGAVKG